MSNLEKKKPVPVAVRSKAWVCDRSSAETVGSNPTRGHGCLSDVSVVCCQVEVSATSWSLVQRSPTDRGASLCVIWKTSRMRKAMTRVGSQRHKKNLETTK